MCVQGKRVECRACRLCIACQFVFGCIRWRGSSCPIRILGCIYSTMENAFPQKPFGRWHPFCKS
jgi:hypothetical protein